jgi:Uma2 family endonuclease
MHIEETLLEYERAHGGAVAHAPLDIVLSEHNVVQPDVVYFKPERRRLLEDWDANRIPPDLAVEILSRSTEARDRGRKIQLLARFQVPEYWIVDPAKHTLEIHVLRDRDYVLFGSYDEASDVSSPSLPGLAFAAVRVFAE